MAKVRSPDDPWYTVLYREPHRVWWGPPIAVFLFLAVFRRLVLQDQTWTEALLLSGVTGLVFLAFAARAYRSRQRRAGQSAGASAWPTSAAPPPGRPD